MLFRSVLERETAAIAVNNLRYFTTLCVLLVTVGLVLSAVRRQEEKP